MTGSLIFSASPFQMALGERAALQGIVADLQPDLAIELGTAEGGSLAVLAKHAKEVHSFDLVAPALPVAELEHVHLHEGNYHDELPVFLRELAAAGRNVDLVLVDGDHTTEGVQRDLEDLLTSEACRNTVVILHDTAAPAVRAGLEAVGLDRHPKVGFVDLDLVSGVLFRDRMAGEIWGGLGVAVLGESPVGRDDSFHRPPDVLALAQAHWYGGAPLADRIARLDESLLTAVPSQTTAEDRSSLLALHAAAAATLGTFKYLEIGSHLGGSLQALVADPRCVAITSIDPRPAAQPDDRGEVFEYPDNSTDRMLGLLREIPDADLSKLVTVEATSSDLDPQSIDRPDVCFVDGEHTARAVTEDAAFCREVLRGDGIIVFHDRSIVGPAIVAFAESLDGPHREYTLDSDLAVVELGSATLLRDAVVRSRMRPFPGLA